MADSQPHRDTSDVGGDTGTPRWAKVFGIIVLLVILLFVVLMFTRGPGGRHGPARHMGSANSGEAHLAATAAETPRDR